MYIPQLDFFFAKTSYLSSFLLFIILLGLFFLFNKSLIKENFFYYYDFEIKNNEKLIEIEDLKKKEQKINLNIIDLVKKNQERTEKDSNLR